MIFITIRGALTSILWGPAVSRRIRFLIRNSAAIYLKMSRCGMHCVISEVSDLKNLHTNVDLAFTSIKFCRCGFAYNLLG